MSVIIKVDEAQEVLITRLESNVEDSIVKLVNVWNLLTIEKAQRFSLEAIRILPIFTLQVDPSKDHPSICSKRKFV